MPLETDDFISEICNFKHENVDKDINDIKENIEDIKKEKRDRYQEIKNMIVELTREFKISSLNLKNKIVLADQRMGDKIDSLNDFDKTLRGNGDPGIWESVRNIKKNIKIIMWAIAIILILSLGGNYEGVTFDSIKEKLGIKKDIQVVKPTMKTTQVIKTTPIVAPKPKTIPIPLPSTKIVPKIVAPK